MKKFLFLFLFTPFFLMGCNNSNSQIDGGVPFAPEQNFEEPQKKVETDYSISGDDVYFHSNLVPEADAKTFEEIGNGYAKDSSFIFYNGEDIENYPIMEELQRYGSLKIDKNNLKALSQKRSATDGFFFFYEGVPFFSKFCEPKTGDCYYIFSEVGALKKDEINTITDIAKEHSFTAQMDFYYIHSTNPYKVFLGMIREYNLIKREAKNINDNWTDIEIFSDEYIFVGDDKKRLGFLVYNHRRAMGEVDKNTFKILPSEEKSGKKIRKAKDKNTLWENGYVERKLNTQ